MLPSVRAHGASFSILSSLHSFWFSSVEMSKAGVEDKIRAATTVTNEEPDSERWQHIKQRVGKALVSGFVAGASNRGVKSLFLLPLDTIRVR